jgi:hypothetical protein
MKNILNFCDPIIHMFALFFERYKKYFPLFSFTGGFLWDSFTLTRIDRLSDNFILLGYILALSILILLVNLLEYEIIRKPFLLKYQQWYPLGIQFFVGGLFSSYVVFYFQSAALTKNWLFLGILIILLISNEFLEKRLTNIFLQIGLLFLLSFSFFIFFIPVITGWMNTFIFILSGMMGVLYSGGIVYVLYKNFNIIPINKFRKILGIIAGLYLIINLFYYFNLIPPVPLSLKNGGIYHYVAKQNSEYKLKFKQPRWYQFWKKSDDPFFYTQGDTVFCFTSVFAPTRLTKRIFHLWQVYHLRQEKWLVTDKQGYDISGGREGGYRGYTYKLNVTPGRWRVDVITEENQILGRINFKIEQVDTKIEELKILMQ